MPSFVDKHGVAVDPVRPLEAEKNVVRKARDLIIVKLLKRRLSRRNIAKVLNVDEKLIRNRLATMPRATREFYERYDMDRLGRT